MSESIRCEATNANGSRCAREGRQSVQAAHGTTQRHAVQLCAVHHTRLQAKEGIRLHNGAAVIRSVTGEWRWDPNPDVVTT
jgi:hypothetical protein